MATKFIRVKGRVVPINDRRENFARSMEQKGSSKKLKGGVLLTGGLAAAGYAGQQVKQYAKFIKPRKKKFVAAMGLLFGLGMAARGVEEYGKGENMQEFARKVRGSRK